MGAGGSLTAGAGRGGGRGRTARLALRGKALGDGEVGDLSLDQEFAGLGERGDRADLEHAAKIRGARRIFETDEFSFH